MQLLYDRHYEKVLNAVDIYDAPNGNIVDHLDAGFNYITIKNYSDDWTEIDTDRWVLDRKPERSAALALRRRRYSRPNCPTRLPGYWSTSCRVPRPAQNRRTAALAAAALYRRQYLRDVHVDDWDWYQIGVDQWVEQRKIAQGAAGRAPRRGRH